MDYKDKYTDLKILTDDTNGIVNLGLIERFEAAGKNAGCKCT